MVMASILSLPNELLQTIASLLSCSSALDLVVVNHQLRAACNDRLVFKTIAERTSQESRSETSKVLSNANLQNTVRIAFAIQKATEIGELVYPDDDALDESDGHLLLNGLRTWMPHIFALGHPLCKTFNLWPLAILYRGLHDLAPTDKDKQCLVDITNLNFCISAIVLGRERTAEGWESIIYDLDSAFDVVLPEWGRGQLPVIYDALTKEIHDLEYHGYNNPIMASTLILCLSLLVTEGPPAWISAPLMAPLPACLPRHAYRDIPDLFQSSPEAFRFCHLDRMVTPEFLSGAWEGYYFANEMEISSLTRCLSNMTLVAKYPQKTFDVGGPVDKRLVDITCEGRDHFGKYSINGIILRNGEVQLTHEDFINSGNVLHSLWSGFLTPFGIVGGWCYHGRRVRHRGWFWIFKKEWCE